MVRTAGARTAASGGIGGTGTGGRTGGATPRGGGLGGNGNDGAVHAITIERPGGPEALRWTEVPDPAPAAGEVLIEVAAAGVNRADVLQRQGNYPPPKDAPPYLGLEVSGRVRAVGAGVHGWRAGQEVCALLGGGGYAQLVAVAAAQVLPVPKGVD